MITHKVLLFSMNTDTIKVTIEMYFDASGNLVVEGYDIGKSVEEFWGDSDYEYSATVSSTEVKKLYLILGLPPDSRKELLSYFQQHYNANDCYSKIREYFTTHDIRHEGFSWS